MIPVYAECDLYYFDEEAADRPCRFIEKYCRHTEGRHAGKPFLLLPWERELVRTLFGWKKRSDHLRRFRELFLLTAKGAGKTPLLAAIGLYMLLGDKEASAHIISMASTARQARLTYEGALSYINGHEKLRGIADPQYHIIKGLGSYKGAKWTTISGNPKGKSGDRPSCIIADEVMEWAGVTAKAYELLTANAFKRSQPLMLVATNAGDNRENYAWQLYERACAVRDGEMKNDTLLPIIYETPQEMEWTTEEAARTSNPSLGSIIQFSDLQPELSKGEGRYRRLYLSQWPKTAEGRWLDMKMWDASEKLEYDSASWPAADYVGLDLSLNNDLSAALFVHATPDRFYVDSHFWMPRCVAEEHQTRFGIPYLDWAKDGHITLVSSPTIDAATRLQIAAYVLAKTPKPKAVGYDRYKADAVIASLEAAGLTCVPIAQGFSVHPGCEELDRRLREGSISIVPNPVLRFCASNTTVKTDDRGNYWPVKPNAKGTYAGLRHAKIDGISALVTAMVEARKADFPNARKMWTGGKALLSSLVPTAKK